MPLTPAWAASMNDPKIQNQLRKIIKVLFPQKEQQRKVFENFNDSAKRDKLVQDIMKFQQIFTSIMKLHRTFGVQANSHQIQHMNNVFNKFFIKVLKQSKFDKDDPDLNILTKSTDLNIRGHSQFPEAQILEAASAA